MGRSAADRRRAPGQRVAGVGLLVFGVVSLSAAGWLTAATPASPLEPTLEAEPPRSERAPEHHGDTTDAEFPNGGSTSPTDTEVGRTRPRATTHPPEPISAAPVAAPSLVEVPSIGVRSELIDLGLDEERQLEVPADPELAGWWVGGPRPGEHGPAVIAGHVDSVDGPAVFWRLHELEPGDRVTVHDEQGSSTAFVVDRVGRWSKHDFPTDEVYRRADGPELRLITCGGSFDDRTRSYQDNVIVFATMAEA